MPGTFIILQASDTCLRFVSSYSSFFRSRSGLVLAEYGIVEDSRGHVEVVLRETPVGDDDVLLHRIIRNITNDFDTGTLQVNYQPFVLQATDLPLLTGLRAAWFEYLDVHPEKSADPLWKPGWHSSDEAPYPEAIRLCWELGKQERQEVIPLRAKLMPRSPFGQ
jgi:hypothetical protein